MATALKTRLLGSQSDERLSELAREGSQIAFEALARRYRRALLRHCRQLCLSQESAQEVLQRSLAEAWSGIQAGAEPQDPRSWLYGIAQRIATEQMRGAVAASAGDLKAAVSEPELPSRGAAASGAPTPDEVLALRSALSAMTPRRERDGIVVHRADGNKVAEDALGIADSAVRGLLGRARRGISALTPPPLLAWALSRAAESGPSGERMAQLGGGAAGLTGLAVKGAVAALTAGVAITGAVVAQSGSHPHAGGSVRPAVGAQSSSPTSLAAVTGPAAGSDAGSGAGGADSGAGRRGGGHSGGHHVLVASISSPKQTSAPSGPSTQPSEGSGSSAGGAQPGQSPAGSQTREARVQTSTTVTRTASAGAGASGTAASSSPSVSVESSSTASTSQSGGGSAGIGVKVSLGGESGQQGGSGGTAGGSGSSSGGSGGEPSSSSESSSTGIGISISLEPIASVGVHVSLP